MSMVTTSAAGDHTLGDDSELLNHMCVLAIARNDGTPLDAASMQEEDIIKLCAEVGWAHPKGVLWLLAMESVIVFQSSEEMLATACMVTKATAWCQESIKLHNSPPSTTTAISELSIHSTMGPVLEPSPSEEEGETRGIKINIFFRPDEAMLEN